MIARISSGNFIKGAVAYNEQKVAEGEASVITMKNFDDDPEESSSAIAEMMMRCAKASANNNSQTIIKKPVFSCSLNLNQVDLDKLKTIREENGEEAENEFYRKIADRYMEGMGYGKQPYIVYKHEDIERTHIHIVSIRVDENRKKINDSNEKLRSERVRKEIAEAMGLSDEGEKKNSELSVKEISSLMKKRSDYIYKTGDAVTELAKLDPSDPSNLNKLRHKISNILKFVDENYQPRNMNEYNKILSQFHIKCNKIDLLDKDGKRISGCQFGVVNDKGEFVSHLMKGGQINERFTLPKLEIKFAVANGLKEDIRKQDAFSKKYITEQIKSILDSPREIDMDYFCDTLRVRGVEANIVKDNDEKIIGINFIDNLNGKVFTGSSLGRDYTWGNLSSKIDKHNKKSDSGILEKDAFAKAIKTLTSSYNEIRKESYYLESDLIKDLPSKKSELTEKLKTELLLTGKQADKCFDTFCRYKLGNLSSIEAKENSYQQSQIITAMMFATKMKDDQQIRTDFFNQMGISIGKRGDSIIYSSERKPDVWMSFKSASENDESLKGGKEPIHEILDPSNDNIPLNKTERQFVKNIIEGGDGSQVKGNWNRMMDLLDQKTLDKVINDEIVQKFAYAVKTLRNKSLKESGLFESDFINRMELLRKPMVDEAVRTMGIGEGSANAIFDKYKQYQNDKVLPAVEEKEKNAAFNRLELSLMFASRIEDPSKKTEFLKRMEISLEKSGDDVKFTYDRKNNISFSSKEIKEKCGLDVKANDFTFANVSDVKPFSKKERDFVKDYLSGEKMMDGRNSTALSYLSTSDQNKAKAVGVATRVSGILNAINTRTADEMVRALLYRGFVIHPTEEDGKTVYKVARFNNRSAEAMATLPKELADRLDNSNFAQVYPTIKNQLLAKGVYGTPKLITVMKVERAGDFRDEALLMESIKEVAKVNKMLADKMTEAAVPGKNGEIDYGRVARLVAEYNGEKTVKLPPTTAESFIRQENKRMESVVNELRNGDSLKVAIKLMKGDDITDNKKQEEESQNFNNNNKKL